MDTSVTIIGLFITVLIGIPLYYAMRSNTINQSKIKQIKNKFSQDYGLNFTITETLNKKVLTIDEKNKGFLFDRFNSKEKEIIDFIDLNTVDSCKLAVTAEGNSNTIEKIDFEFQYKNKTTKLIPIYRIENDQINQICLYEERQWAKKWREIFQNCISN